MMAKRIKDPRQMAVAAVQKWFDQLSGASCSFSEGTDQQTLGTDVFIAIEKALKPEGEEERDDIIANLLDAREAGYLVGLQVGLRLRSQGVK